MPPCPGISRHCLLVLLQEGQWPAVTQTPETTDMPKIPVLALIGQVTLTGETHRTSNFDKDTSLKHDFGKAGT